MAIKLLRELLSDKMISPLCTVEVVIEYYFVHVHRKGFLGSDGQLVLEFDDAVKFLDENKADTFFVDMSGGMYDYCWRIVS